MNDDYATFRTALHLARCKAKNAVTLGDERDWVDIGYVRKNHVRTRENRKGLSERND